MRETLIGGYEMAEKLFEIHEVRVYNETGNIVFVDGQKIHREDGPALIRPDGTSEYYWEGEKKTKEEFGLIEKKKSGGFWKAVGDIPIIIGF